MADRPLEQYHRRSIRLYGYDYGMAGAYFITICTHKKFFLFGDIVDGTMCFNSNGIIAVECWQALPVHFPEVVLDWFAVMPNHIHGIVIITVGATHASPLQNLSTIPNGPNPKTLGAIVGSYKSAVAKRINEQRRTTGVPVWQRNYYDHIIRNENELANFREYIETNPIRWTEDSENPHVQ